MSNILDFQVSRQRPSTVGGTGTTTKYFPSPALAKNYLAPVIRQDAQSFQAPITFPNNNAVNPNPSGALFLPVGNKFDGQVLDVIVAGAFGADTGDPSGTVNFDLQIVTGTFTAPVFTSLCNSGAVSPTFPGVAPIAIIANLMADGASGMLQGSYQVFMQGQLIKSLTVINNVITGLDFTVGNPALQRGAVFGLVVGCTFGTTDKSNIASLFEFTVES